MAVVVEVAQLGDGKTVESTRQTRERDLESGHLRMT
jgi:hypothetical protein